MSLEDGGGGWDKLVEGMDPEQPVAMLNLIKFHEQAQYEPDSGEAPCSGAEAYKRYGDANAPALADAGGELILNGMAELIGPDDEWDMRFVVRYPRLDGFLAMIASERYRAVVHHRAAAVVDSRLLMMRFTEDGKL